MNMLTHFSLPISGPLNDYHCYIHRTYHSPPDSLAHTRPVAEPFAPRRGARTGGLAAALAHFHAIWITYMIVTAHIVRVVARETQARVAYGQRCIACIP